ncbi:NAD(P)H-hydrate epimerase [Novosphingobium piscinae]|uniref:ADP-dependent (S)-NAD(P)H-hydrate dehydratase n=2 Tax=Novosphingobium piscinae TaxID=1507448 RepID=A0A7X1KNV3_9SPHN|nr:NAD(P)H-hydrate epimerase [Novosphingobium piscinae]
MRAAEQALIAAGSSVDTLMQRAGRGAADWVWRIAAGRRVTVLCGPGNNGGDGYVIAAALRERGAAVQVIAAMPPRTDAARTARALLPGTVLDPAAAEAGEVLVDCLFGSGLTRPLGEPERTLLGRLAAQHALRIAIDVPSGVDSDRAVPLNPGLPTWHVTLALGAWKPAHLLMPACAAMGALRLVDIGCAAVPGAPGIVARPQVQPPAADAHKYRRGLVAVVVGAMPGAARLAAAAAQGAGAGYVRLVLPDGSVSAEAVAPDLVITNPAALADPRTAALLVGPGLGRDAAAGEALAAALAPGRPAVLDADALGLLTPAALRGYPAPLVLTPHEGELAALERAFALPGEGTKLARAGALARATGAVVIAKGPDTVIAAPDGRSAFALRAPSWLAVAGTGDVLAGIAAARLAAQGDPFAAAGEAVWLHGEAARRAGPAFAASQLAAAVRSAYAACL